MKKYSFLTILVLLSSCSLLDEPDVVGNTYEGNVSAYYGIIFRRGVYRLTFDTESKCTFDADIIQRRNTVEPMDTFHVRKVLSYSQSFKKIEIDSLSDYFCSPTGVPSYGVKEFTVLNDSTMKTLVYDGISSTDWYYAMFKRI